MNIFTLRVSFSTSEPSVVAGGRVFGRQQHVVPQRRQLVPAGELLRQASHRRDLCDGEEVVVEAHEGDIDQN